MNRLWYFLRGYQIVEVSGAEPQLALNKLTAAHVFFWNIRWIDSFTVRFRLFPRDYAKAAQAASLGFCELQPVRMHGIWQETAEIRHRVFLWLPVLLGMLLMLVLPRFVFFYEVKGNAEIPDAQILRELEQLGIGFGTIGARIRSQWVEDHLLNRVDGLQWVTVNQKGCRAIVEVRERPKTPAVRDRKGFCNVMASRDGIIESQIVFSGQSLKQVGDAVLAGEMLVSGVVDLERTFLLTRAHAEIFARTWRKIEAAAPQNYMEKGESIAKMTAVWLEIGNHRIKFFGNSGISTACCDKMISRKILSLPGGAQLPVSLLVETCVERMRTMQTDDRLWVQQHLSDAVSDLAHQQMTAGEILQQRENLTLSDGLYRLSAVLECREMIAETTEANWIEKE